MTKPTELGSASTAWMRHLVWNGCPVCYRGATSVEDRFCAAGRLLKDAAVAEMTGKPIGTGKRAGKVWPA